jgi:glycosyltransferase involved in cell wall biosynthesis
MQTPPPLRILLTTWQDFGAGSIQSVQNLAEGLHERGHYLRVATPADGVLGRRLRATGVPLVDFRFERGWSLRSARALARLVREEAFDLVDAQESRDRKAAILARWLFRMPGKLLISRRQLSFTLPPENMIYGAAVDCVVANSYAVARSLRGIPDRKIVVVQSGHNPRRLGAPVSPGEVEALRRELALDPDLPTVGVVARRKDQGALLRALIRLGRPVNVLFVGIERDQELERLEAELPRGARVVYTGFVDRPHPYYHLLDVKVLPSYNEGLPQALFEAMSVGVPVVASVIGGTPEMIRDGKNGFLFANRDEATLALHLETLLDRPDVRARLIEAGRRTAGEEYTTTGHVRKAEALYRALLEGRPLPGSYLSRTELAGRP